MTTTNRSTMSRRIATRVTLRAVVAGLALPVVFASCADPPMTPLAKTSREITSGTVPGGQRALFFLTRPMDRRKFAGTFDASLQPQVLVCTAVPCISPVLGPISLGSTGAATLRLDRRQQAYVFSWRTNGAKLAADSVYRLVVRVGDYQLGWVDLATGAKQRDLRTVNRREFVPVRLGSTVTLPFRIEQGAPFPPDLPGRYESDPSACPQGCLIHPTPDLSLYGVWGGVQITQTGFVTMGWVGFYEENDGTPPVIPPIPAPGTGPLPFNGLFGVDTGPTMLDWSFDETSPGCLDLFSEGIVWGSWCGTFGGPAGISTDFAPLWVFGGLQRLPNYLPPIQ